MDELVKENQNPWSHLENKFKPEQKSKTSRTSGIFSISSSIPDTPEQKSSEQVEKMFEKIKKFFERTDNVDDIYDKLEECMQHLDRITMKKDQTRCWTDTDFDRVAQVYLVIGGCQIKTKFLD